MDPARVPAESPDSHCVLCPLGRGFLAGTITGRDDLAADDWRLKNPRFSAEALEGNRRLVGRIAQIATAKGVTPSQVALAWMLSRGDDMATIPGTRRSTYLRQNWASQDIVLSPAEKADLDSFSRGFEVVGNRY